MISGLKSIAKLNVVKTKERKTTAKNISRHCAWRVKTGRRGHT